MLKTREKIGPKPEMKVDLREEGEVVESQR